MLTEQIQTFHLENDGLIIYFGEYDCPYAAGLPSSYSIRRSDLIDTSDFWKHLIDMEPKRTPLLILTGACGGYPHSIMGVWKP